MSIHLVAYCNRYYTRQQRRLVRSARRHGIHHIHAFGEKDLQKTNFYRENRAILDSPRGAGFCAWKPYFILQILKTLSPEDVLLYVDSGAEFIQPAEPLAKTVAKETDVALFSNGENLNKIWTKRDCFVQMECDEPRFWESYQVNGAIHAYRKSTFSLQFLEEWLAYCCMPSVITDSPSVCGKPEFPEFKDHRYDQSVLSNLAIKYNMPIFRDPSQWGNYSKSHEFRVDGEWLSQPYQSVGYTNSPYGTIFNHHREIGFRLWFMIKLKLLIKRLFPSAKANQQT